MKPLIHNVIESFFKRLGISVLFRNDARLEIGTDGKSGGGNMAGMTAAMTKYGFWYVGNIFNRHDIAYGILQNGTIKEPETDMFIYLLDLAEKIRNTSGQNETTQSKTIQNEIEKNTINQSEKITMYDLGANTGYYSLLAATKAHCPIEIHAFEPIPDYANQIKKNAYINRLEDKITVHELAASNENGSFPLYLAGLGSSLNSNFPANNSQTLNVKTVTLDSYLAENQNEQQINQQGKKNLAAPDIMKIDIESHELSAIKGMEQMLKKSYPILFIEIIKNMGNFSNPNFEETFSYIKNLGYEAYFTAPISGAQFDIQSSSQSITTKRQKLEIIEDVSKVNGEKIEMYTFIPKSKVDEAKKAGLF